MTKRVIIAGGGTGGHIFPAIAIAHALKKLDPSIEILFVGAKGKMEMEKVPQAGFDIIGLDIAGFNRSSLIKNIGLPFKLLKSLWQARSILVGFLPNAVVGVGGYASFPMLRQAQRKKIPTLIQEQNSHAGKSNTILGRKANRICVAYEGMDKFFPADRILLTGNPVRATISGSTCSREEGAAFFKLDPSKKILLVVGGSLGARSINEAMESGLDTLLEAGIQVIWQTGKPFLERASAKAAGKQGVWVNDFITQMEFGYAAADAVISRAGAMAIAELCVLKKPVLFVPFPFAAEDHQTVNAQSLVKKNAALMVKDSEAKEKVVPMMLDLLNDEAKRMELVRNISELGITDADERIAREVLALIKNK